MYASPAVVRDQEQEKCIIRRKEEGAGGGTGRGVLARAAAATILYVFSVLFLSQLLLLYLLVPIQE